MNELIRVAAGLQAFCEARRWRFCFIGGLALQRWGEPRETIAVDLTLLTGFGGEAPFVEALLDRYAGRTDDAAGFAAVNRVLLLRSASGVGNRRRARGAALRGIGRRAVQPVHVPREHAAAHLLGRRPDRPEGVRRPRTRLGRRRRRDRPAGRRPRLGLHRRPSPPAGGAEGRPRDFERTGEAPGGDGTVDGFGSRGEVIENPSCPAARRDRDSDVPDSVFAPLDAEELARWEGGARTCCWTCVLLWAWSRPEKLSRRLQGLLPAVRRRAG